MEGIKTGFAVGLDAANAIANFSANLDVVAGGSFSGSVNMKAVFAGAAETTVSININLHDITSMTKHEQLVDHIGSGFS